MGVRVLATYNVRSLGGEGQPIRVFTLGGGDHPAAAGGNTEHWRAPDVPPLQRHMHPRGSEIDAPPHLDSLPCLSTQKPAMANIDAIRKAIEMSHRPRSIAKTGR